ncbi:MAG: UvrD-helicase domain-containing protein [Chloroflexi bacterium]|nr:UvrD-helicase domain-containing protein [Chloroflexota bacterium]
MISLKTDSIQASKAYGQEDVDIIADLNAAQKQAVEAIDGPVLILAGPGSGKTRVITYRIAYLIRVCGVSPRHILAVTFTNKAAQEMKERLHALVAENVQQLTVGTFHAFSAHILRREASHLGLDSSFVIYDDDDQISLIKQAMKNLNIDEKRFAPKAIQSAISKAKSELLRPTEYLAKSYFEEVVRRVYEAYHGLLWENRALDFDDLLTYTSQLFHEHPTVLERYQDRFIHLLVDEFQDTNIAQYDIVKMLAARHQNICVVGDPDQSIYSWRNADIRNILDFERDYPQAKVIFLEQNYRSCQHILDAAEKVVSPNQQRRARKLWTDKGPGIPLALMETQDEQDEARFVASEIERLTAKGLCTAGDCAVMYRTNAQSRALEDVFLRYGIPYRLVAGTRFYERKEIKDLIAYLRLIHNPSDSISLNRIINVPPRGIGPRAMTELAAWAISLGQPIHEALRLIAEETDTGKDHQDSEKRTDDSAPSPSVSLSPRTKRALGDFASMVEDLGVKSEQVSIIDLLDHILDTSGYRAYLQDGTADGDERWENVLELRTVAREFIDLSPRSALASFLERVALVSDVDAYDERADAVTLITLHASKGLEFSTVFIAGMEEGLFPLLRSMEDPDQMEEERRLCYVGITRAMERLYLVRASYRTIFGNSARRPASRFWKDLLPQAAQRQSADKAPPVLSVPQSPFFSVGDQVRHAKFGQGIVVDCLEQRNDQEITVRFGPEIGTKRLLLSYAPLEKV